MGCLRSLDVPSLCAEHMASWAGKLSAGERAESRNSQARVDLKASEKEKAAFRGQVAVPDGKPSSLDLDNDKLGAGKNVDVVG